MDCRIPMDQRSKDLPDNKKAAFATLISTKRRLAKNSEHAKVYKEQIQEMVNRGVARKLTKAELQRSNTLYLTSRSTKARFEVHPCQDCVQQQCKIYGSCTE